jgi:hypothetical protein
LQEQLDYAERSLGDLKNLRSDYFGSSEYEGESGMAK